MKLAAIIHECLLKRFPGSEFEVITRRLTCNDESIHLVSVAWRLTYQLTLQRHNMS